MIMPRGKQLLLPVRPVFIWASLTATLALGMVQNMVLWGRAAWLPDVAAVVLLFWAVHQPLRVGIGAGFALGLLIDLHQGSLLGQHALAYTALCFLAVGIHRRLLWFTITGQMAQVLGLFVVGHLLALLVRLIAGDAPPGWSMLLAPLLETLLWPVVSVLLLIPQRQAPDPDTTRPL
ncbi:MAG: rod shape-determining protein MreD [Rhodoferax sp.]|nr:rod shape-determining protein MreD [Rhodoferax sp.]